MISKNQMKFVRSLQLKKNRDTHNCFIAEGERIIDELLNSDYNVLDLFATKHWQEAEYTGDYISRISENELERISALKTPNKVLAVVEKPNNDLNFGFLNKGLTLVLEDIKNPGNLGTIIRVCDWFGVENIICSFSTVDLYNPKVIQATMGSFTRVNLFFTDLDKVISDLPKDYPIYGAFTDGMNVVKTKLEANSLLIMGNESYGISEKIESLVNNKISIPPKRNGAESLNVAVATSILLHEFRR
jgi:TrmH family RNA methyltransferase|tara:strand:- start:27 stop:761 length:735 start_codon:yes stop_codon:yes gene_type:complete